MSNSTLVKNMEGVLASYLEKKISRKELILAVEVNGRALEMMPYGLKKDIDNIECQLTTAQFADEDGFLPEEEKTIEFLKSWLKKFQQKVRNRKCWCQAYLKWMPYKCTQVLLL